MKATLRYLRVSPRKTRLVADLVRGKQVEDAIFTLMTTHRAASESLRKLISSAVANAEDLHDADPDLLYIREIYVN